MRCKVYAPVLMISDTLGLTVQSGMYSETTNDLRLPLWLFQLRSKPIYVYLEYNIP